MSDVTIPGDVFNHVAFINEENHRARCNCFLHG